MCFHRRSHRPAIITARSSSRANSSKVCRRQDALELDAVDFITSARDCVIWYSFRVGLGQKWSKWTRARKAQNQAGKNGCTNNNKPQPLLCLFFDESQRYLAYTPLPTPAHVPQRYLAKEPSPTTGVPACDGAHPHSRLPFVFPTLCAPLLLLARAFLLVLSLALPSTL